MKKTIVYADKVNFFYTHFKKHCCPECGRRVQTRYIDKSVNSNSPEAKEYDFSDTEGEIRFRTVYFYCPDCKKDISLDDMKGFEKNKNL